MIGRVFKSHGYYFSLSFFLITKVLCIISRNLGNTEKHKGENRSYLASEGTADNGIECNFIGFFSLCLYNTHRHTGFSNWYFKNWCLYSNHKFLGQRSSHPDRKFTVGLHGMPSREMDVWELKLPARACVCPQNSAKPFSGGYANLMATQIAVHF